MSLNPDVASCHTNVYFSPQLFQRLWSQGCSSNRFLFPVVISLYILAGMPPICSYIVWSVGWLDILTVRTTFSTIYCVMQPKFLWTTVRGYELYSLTY